MNSTASNPESKMYAFEAGARAIKAHFKRQGIEVDSVEKGVDFGIYHTRFHFDEEPLVSVIIPNKDHRGESGALLKLTSGQGNLQKSGSDSGRE